jgi:membrane-associated protease RseP (regulator of RpoE activity)
MMRGFSVIVTCLLAIAAPECGHASEPGRFRRGAKSLLVLAQSPGAEKQTSAQPGSAEPANAESGKTGGRKTRGVSAPSESPESASAEPGKTGGRKTHAIGAEFEAAGEGAVGLRVKNIEENGPADVAGLKADDVIVSADGHPFKDPRQLEAYLSAQAGRLLPIIVDRKGSLLTMQLGPQVTQLDSGWLGVQLDEEPLSGAMTGAYTQYGNVQFQPPRALPANGAVIAVIEPEGPASRAGLRPGDIVTSLNGKKIGNPAELVADIYEMKPESKVEITILRNNQTQKISLNLGSRKEEIAAYRRFGQSQYGPAGSGQFAGQYGGQYAPQYFQQGSNGQFAGGQQFSNPQTHQMMMEQNHRIEQELRQLREEVKQLREQVQKK